MSILPKDRAQIVALKAQGKTQSEIAEIVYPDRKPGSARVQVARVLQNVTVKDALEKALSKHNITLDRALRPIADALDATKIVGSPTEPDYEIPDHAIRLRAGKEARELLGVNNTKAEDKPPTMTQDDLHALANTSDEVKLTEMLFKRDSDKQDTIDPFI